MGLAILVQDSPFLATAIKLLTGMVLVTVSLELLIEMPTLVGDIMHSWGDELLRFFIENPKREENAH